MTLITKCLGVLATTFLVTGCGVAATPAAPSGHSSTSTTPSAPKTVSPTATQSSVPVTAQMAAESSMTAIDFTSQQTGWLAGSGQIWKTTHQGATWSRVYDGSTDFRGIQFVGQESGWVWGYHRIVRTTNEGRTWTRIFKEPHTIITVNMTSATNGYAVFAHASASTALYGTEDGGQHWARIPTPFTPLTVAFFNTQIGWAVSHHKIWKTVDAGKTWTASDTLVSPLPQSAKIRVGGATVWVQLLGGSGMSQTSYTVLSHVVGQGWIVRAAKSTAGAGPAPDVTGSAPNAPGLDPGPLLAVNSNTAYLAGEIPAAGLGTTAVWTTTNQGKTWAQEPEIYGLNGIPGPRALSFTSPHVGWLVGGAGNTTVFRTVDGGATWRQIFPPEPTPVQSVTFVNSHHGYGLGEPGHPNAVMASQDGGQQWSQIATLPTAHSWQTAVARQSMAFTSAQSGWIVRNDQLWHTKDGGTQWSLVSLPGFSSTDSLSVIAFIGNNGVVGSPYSNTAWWTTNQGASWHQTQHESLGHVLATMNPNLNREANRLGQPIFVAGSHGSLVWIVFQNQRWALSTNGGSSWTTHNFPSNILTTVGTVNFVSAHDGWFETAGSILYSTTNGGKHWTRVY